MNGVAEHLRLKPDDYDKFSRMFGSTADAVLTLLKATTGGADWSDTYDLMTLIGPFYALLMLLYLAFSIFVLWNIITSVFMQKIMQFAEPDVGTLLKEKKETE